MRAPVRWLLLDAPGDARLNGRRGRAPPAAFVPRIEACNARLLEARFPARDSRLRSPQRLHYVLIRLSVGERQN
jgi:hypothetical protein